MFYCQDKTFPCSDILQKVPQNQMYVLCSDLVYFYAIGFMVGNSQSFFSLRLLPTGFDINVIIDLRVWFEIFYESFGKILLFSDGLVSGFYEPARPNW